jgi:hypothetical protein
MTSRGGPIGSSRSTPGVEGKGVGPNNETRTFSLPSLKKKVPESGPDSIDAVEHRRLIINPEEWVTGRAEASAATRKREQV